MKKVKKLVLSIGVFHILYGENLLKHKVVVAQTPEWKFNPTQDEPFQDCSWMRVREGGGGGENKKPPSLKSVTDIIQ